MNVRNPRPQVSLEKAAELIRTLYGLRVSHVKSLVGYDDLNFFFTAAAAAAAADSATSVGGIGKNGYVLKVTNSQDSKQPGQFLAQGRVMTHLAKEGMSVPVPVPDLKGDLQTLQLLRQKEEGSGEEYEERFLVRVLTFLPGRTLLSLGEWTEKHFFQCGQLIGRLHRETLKLPRDEYLGSRSDYPWSLSAVPNLPADSLWAVEDEERRATVKEVVQAFTEEVVPALAAGRLEEGVLHGDVNEQNVLVDEKGGGVRGIIDFGDCSRGPLVFDVAIAIMYMMILWGGGGDKAARDRSLSAGGHVLAGYLRQRRLAKADLRVLPVCVAARFVQSLTLGEVAHANNPDNEYVLVVARAGAWRIVDWLWKMPQEEVARRWTDVVDSYEVNSTPQDQ